MNGNTNENYISLIQISWKLLTDRNTETGVIFYQKLFSLEPALRAKFHGDLTEQRTRLMLMIDSAVKSVEFLDEMGQPFHSLGVRHAEYGVQPEDFRVFEAALIATLQQMLGEQWSDQLQEAWQWMFARIETMMLNKTDSEVTDQTPD